jgi:membrane-bound ClpP family serine protease
MRTEDRLAEGVGKLRGRSRRDEIVERVLMIGGGVLLLGGFVAIVIGWFGASHTPLPFEQTPFIISGGLLGLALVFAGGFFYFAYWLTRMVRETRESREEANKAFRTMNEMAELLATVLKDLDSQEASPNGQAFVATEGGTMFHRADCSVVQGRRDLRKVSAQESGMDACKMCDPLGAAQVTA